MLSIIFAIFPAIPGLGGLSSVAWIAAIALAALYYRIPIAIALIIMFYEMLLHLDIAGTAASALNNLTKVLAKNSILGSISILPSSQTKPNQATQVDIFKMDSYLNIFINLNRGFLYFAFILSLTTLFPLQQALRFPMDAYVVIFNMMNLFILQLEPLGLMILLIIVAPLQKVVYVLTDFMKLITG